MADIKTVTVNGVTYNVKDTVATTKTRYIVTLTVDGWSDKSQTVNLSGVTADNDLFIAPVEDSAVDYYDADIRASAQAAGQLIFICETVPTASLMVNVVIFG